MARDSARILPVLVARYGECRASADLPQARHRLASFPALRRGLKSLARRVRGSHDPARTEAIAFDTHRSVKRLTDCGFTEQQAEVLVDQQVALLDANLATKADIEAIRAEIEALRQETKAGIEAVKSDLLKWMFGALIAQSGLIVAVVTLLQ